MVRSARVGALIPDDRSRFFVQRRNMGKRLLPGTWDIVVGRLAVVGVLLMLLGACQGGDGGEPAVGFGEPEHAGLCESLHDDVGSDSGGAPSRQEAVDRFVAATPPLEPTTIVGHDIIFRERVVGSVDVQRAPAGAGTWQPLNGAIRRTPCLGSLTRGNDRMVRPSPKPRAGLVRL